MAQPSTNAAPPPPPSGGNNNGQLQPLQKRFTGFREFLTKRLDSQIQMALPKHMRSDRFIRIVLTEVTKNPKLLDCTQESMILSLLHCAQLGLDVGSVLGQAYLVPFRNQRKGGVMEVQLIPGYKGLVKLAYQSGEVGAIRARIVRERDRFDYEYGLREHLYHAPFRGPDAGEMVAVYAVAQIKRVNDAQFLVLERHEVEHIRDKFSKAAGDGPWVTDFDEMAKKSALRRLCKLLPASTENDALARAVVTDERAEAGLEPDYGNAIDIQAVAAEGGEGEVPEPQSDLDRLAASKRSERATTPPAAATTPGAPAAETKPATPPAAAAPSKGKGKEGPPRETGADGEVGPDDLPPTGK